MKKIGFILLVGVLMSLESCFPGGNKDNRVLVFTKTAGFRHQSIPEATKAIMRLGSEKGFIVDTTSDSKMFNEDTLKKFAAVIFVSTTGQLLSPREQADFERYIQAGGGFVGMHAAADAEYDWYWYRDLVGAYFKNHPQIQEATLDVSGDQKFPSTDSLPEEWKRTDEWYNFRALPKDVNVLVSIDERSYKGGENGDHHPLVWYHNYDGGRSFYFGLGHTDESYQDPLILGLLEDGIRYAIGRGKKLNYRKAHSLRKPDDNRFTKTILGGGLDEPTQLTILPDFDILISERKGDIKLFKASDSSLKIVNHLPVYYKALKAKGVNVETGLLGIHADPDFEKNNWVYVYYSPVGISVDRLSRFKFENDSLNLKTEQVILDVQTDREICCHTGGSIAFDKDKNLYLSVGDNSTPFDEVDSSTGKPYPINLHGFSPLDDRPGFRPYDDRRAAGNTNDLRGKILRIHVNEDGSYSIPEGNLFPPGTEGTRPEIYVMGGRNLYRISVDQHNSYVYWGDVGPDARADSLATRGPRGYDEVNQAREAGNFGWPYFVGNNYPYVAYNYATGVSGAPFDPDSIINDSGNNTGLKKLPPAKPAFIWYPYDQSFDFPILGSGARTAMAGPVYYVNDYQGDQKFPAYYDGKFFMYEWSRDFIMAISMDKEGNLRKIEPFMRDTKFHHIMDMKAGKDGKLYMVEYGAGWYSKNLEAALAVVSYNKGNRPPVVEMNLNTISGSLPLKVVATADKSLDPDGDKLSYHWIIENVGNFDTENPVFEHTFDKEGVYKIKVKVSDGKGGDATSKEMQIFAGNNMPKVNIDITGGNPDYYLPHVTSSYQVKVEDTEDGNSAEPGFDPDHLNVELGYMPYSESLVNVNNNPSATTVPQGMALMQSLDCEACHQIDRTSVGPSYMDVAGKYKPDSKVIRMLVDKIIDGGSGNWGQRAMSAHPDLPKDKAEIIVDWILSLESGDHLQSHSLTGTFIPSSRFELDDKKVITIKASYSDKGNGEIPSLTGSFVKVLKNPQIGAEEFNSSAKIQDITYQGTSLKIINEDGWVKIPSVSLTDIHGITLIYSKTSQDPGSGFKAGLRLDSEDGKEVSSQIIGNEKLPDNGAIGRVRFFKTLNLKNVNSSSERHDLFVAFDKINKNEAAGIVFLGIRLE